MLFTYFTSISTAQTDCLHLREQCVNAANGCESVWNIVEDVCNISGNSLWCTQVYFELLNGCIFIGYHNIAVVTELTQ